MYIVCKFGQIQSTIPGVYEGRHSSALNALESSERLKQSALMVGSRTKSVRAFQSVHGASN